MQLGFAPSVESMLRCNACFKPAQFDLLLDRKAGEDQFCFCVHLERTEAEMYGLKYYTATLRKSIVVPIELEKLDHVMRTVDWPMLVGGKTTAVDMESSSIQSAYEILEELNNAGPASDLLKYKYWIGTPLESMIQSLSALKSEWEISERFYFFDDVAVITFDDAMRFLGSKWMERQMSVKRKLLIKKTDAGKPGGGVAGGKLLGKIPRRVRRTLDKNL